MLFIVTYVETDGTLLRWDNLPRGLDQKLHVDMCRYHTIIVKSRWRAS